MSIPLVKLSQVKKHYLNQVFDLEIEKEDFIVVSGENGKGKTTLIQLLLGFIHPDQGLIEGKKLKIGYLPEKAMLPLFIKVHTYLETLSKIKKSKVDHELIYMFKVPLSKSIHELSKGNQQKLAIISTFIGNPDLIILDEPLSGLDQESCDILKDYMTYKRSCGMSFMVSTHQPERFSHLASKHLKL
jgi:ABC-type multidrug transport system ATPase subunit